MRDVDARVDDGDGLSGRRRSERVDAHRRPPPLGRYERVGEVDPAEPSGGAVGASRGERATRTKRREHDAPLRRTGASTSRGFGATGVRPPERRKTASVQAAAGLELDERRRTPRICGPAENGSRTTATTAAAAREARMHELYVLAEIMDG